MLRKESRASRKRGQSVVELAVLLPLLMVLFSIIIEGGLAINGWIRVNTAARDATRFKVDAGRPDDVVTLVQNKLKGIDFGSSSNYTNTQYLDVYIIAGATDGSGNVSTWTADHRYGSRTGGPNITSATIRTRLWSQGGTAAQNVSFTIVEVDYQYTPLLATLIAPGTKLPMSSFAIVQQY